MLNYGSTMSADEMSESNRQQDSRRADADTHDNNPGFLEELEIAKALSLETLELERIRRKRFMPGEKVVVAMDSAYSVRMEGLNTSVKSFQSSTTSACVKSTLKNNCKPSSDENKSKHVGAVVKADVRSRPRPGPSRQCSVTVQALPPPPRRKNSAPLSLLPSEDLHDLMTFSCTDESGSARSHDDLDTLMNFAFGQKNNSNDAFLLNSASSGVISVTTNTKSHCMADGFIVPQNHSNLPSSYAFPQYPYPRMLPEAAIHTQQFPHSFYNVSPACNNDSATNLPSTFWTKPGATGAFVNLTSQHPLSAKSLGKTDMVLSSSAPQPWMSSSCSSVDVLKVIEKKPNENLIDFSYFDSVVMWGSSVSPSYKQNSFPKLKDDLLKSFDPLLVKDESEESTCDETNLIRVPVSVVTADESKTLLMQGDNLSSNPKTEGVKLKQQMEMSDSGMLDFGDKDSFSEDSAPPVPRRHHSKSCSLSNNAEVQIRQHGQVVDSVSRRAVCYKRRCNRIYEGIRVLSSKHGTNLEIEAFCNNVKRLRQEFLNDDHHTNVGLVISPMLESLREETMSIKLIVFSPFMEKPISFTCDVATSVEHVISQTVCTIFDDIRNITLDSYVLKVHGTLAYLAADSCLADYEYVHHCQKFDEDVRLSLLDTSDLPRPLARTAQDDALVKDIVVSCLLPPVCDSVSKETLAILAETLEGEVARLEEQASQGYVHSVQPKGVIQAVKAICATLAQVETKEVCEAVEDLQQVAIAFSKYPLDKDISMDTYKELIDVASTQSIAKLSSKMPNSPKVRMELLKLALARINEAIHNLLDMFSRGFQLNFKVQQSDPSYESIKDITAFLDTVLVHVSSVHRIPPQWATVYENFVVSCELYHGTRPLCYPVETKSVSISTSFYEKIFFDEWVEMSSVLMCLLPRECRLTCTLFGVKKVVPESKSSDAGQQEIKVPLGWAAVQIFDYNGIMTQGSVLCGMWSDELDKRLGPGYSNISDPHCPVIQINLPDFGSIIIFPPVMDNCPSQRKHFESLPSYVQQQLLNTIENSSPIQSNVADEREFLWEKRHYLYDIPQALPKVLLSAHSWDWACLADIYTMIREWKAMNPLDALELLLPCFPDTEVRKAAIGFIKNMGSDELCDYLPQLVQALKYETYEDSPTVWFLIERSLTSIRVMHHLYWLLKQNLEDVQYGHRITLLLNTLLAIAGKAMKTRLEDQEKLVANLADIALKIKSAKDSLRLNILHNDLESTHCLLEEMPTCLPLNPSVEICGIEIKMCSYFTSNTVPLKLNFKNSERTARPVEAIFKDGDDLRQDMITLQMIRIMDKLWLKEGFDLKIITFACVPTAYKKGIVELVKGSETLRKIQTEHGLTGSFKDHPIAEWLRRHNATELEYQQAVDNFTLSCAGYSVATYVLGICDRHNDNIMIRTSGHIFHIDFGKFLGDSQMFGSIKRDRVPFVLTSDMAYVINGGDKPSSKFQNFVDICCQAFNVIRKHGNLFLHLFALMVSAGIPGVTTEAVAYIQKSLLLDVSDAEAAVSFARMIEDSLKSWSTQFNFFIHNLAQLRFTGPQNSNTTLSFIPKTYTIETDGRIKSLDVVSYHKCYDPEKVYMYVLSVERYCQPEITYLLRSYREFCEFHQKLCTSFPLAKYQSLPRAVYLGRSNIRQVAEKRKVEIKTFLRSLWCMADEIKHCDLVYTFFHPLLRDQHEDLVYLSKDATEGEICSEDVTTCQLKLSMHYKKDTFFVMIFHARNLHEVKGQAPDSYVKTYLLPDPSKSTKRKTKVVRKNCHPVFMEMLVYRLPLHTVCQRVLHVSIWDYDRMTENAFLGGVSIPLSKLNLTKEITDWFLLNDHFV